MYTVMVYLNDCSCYQDGDTVFYSTDDEGVPTKEAARVRGVKGTALVFKHDLWHAGLALSSGTKYILRTDLMFVRIAASPFATALRYRDESKYVEAEALFQDSIRCAVQRAATTHSTSTSLQQEGKPTESTTAYLAALDLHAALANSTPPCASSSLSLSLTLSFSGTPTRPWFSPWTSCC